MDFDIFSKQQETMDQIFKELQEARDEHTSEGIFKHLIKEIQIFEKSLDDSHEVGAMLASFGQSVTIHVNELTYIYPKLIIFKGKLENESEVKLVQHINQLNFLLVKVKKLNPKEPRRPIGFRPWDK